MSGATLLALLLANAPADPAPGQFSCRIATCRQITSCAEACYKYLACGFRWLDGDRDGIPCENLCSRPCPPS